MDKISVLVICAIFSAIFYASVEGQNIVAPGCCPGGAGGFAVLAPPPVYVECHSPERDDSRVDPAFTGYGYQAGGCPNVAACAPGVLTCTPGHVVSRTLFAPSSFSYQAGCGGSGIYQRTWCGDNCFGAPLCSGQQQITVRDTTPPVLGVPGTANLECGLNDYSPNQERTESGFANWYDHCTLHSSFQPSISDSAPAALCGSGTGIITRTYSLTDLCLHTTTDVQIINIVDTIPPILRGVFDEIIEAGVNSAVSNPTAEDLCTNVPTITRTNFQYPGRCQAESTTERVYVVSDSCGNSRRYSSILTVQDTLPPTCTDSGSPVTSQDFFVLCTAFPPAPSAAIACSDASGLAVVVTRDDYETFQLLDPDNDESREALDRTLVRNYTATDTCGNTLNWVYRYHIQQVSTITYVTGASVTILPGQTGTVTFSFNVGTCPLRGARLHYDVYPLVLTGTGSAGCLEINGGRQVVGDSYCVIPTPSALGAFTFNVGVYVPFTFEEDKLTIRFEVTALNQLDLSAGTYGEVTVHTA